MIIHIQIAVSLSLVEAFMKHPPAGREGGKRRAVVTFEADEKAWEKAGALWAQTFTTELVVPAGSNLAIYLENYAALTLADRLSEPGRSSAALELDLTLDPQQVFDLIECERLNDTADAATRPSGTPAPEMSAPAPAVTDERTRVGGFAVKGTST